MDRISWVSTTDNKRLTTDFGRDSGAAGPSFEERHQ